MQLASGRGHSSSETAVNAQHSEYGASEENQVVSAVGHMRSREKRLVLRIRLGRQISQSGKRQGICRERREVLVSPRSARSRGLKVRHSVVGNRRRIELAGIGRGRIDVFIRAGWRNLRRRSRGMGDGYWILHYRTRVRNDVRQWLDARSVGR